MTKQQRAYEKVEAFQKQHPEMKRSAIFKKLKVSSTAYYKHRATLGDTKAAPKRKYTRQVVRAVPASPSMLPQVTVIMGTPDQIRAVLQ